MKETDGSHLEHAMWRGQFHVVFAPKYLSKRDEIYRKIKQDARIILRKLYEQKGVDVRETHVCKGPIHRLINISSNIINCK